MLELIRSVDTSGYGEINIEDFIGLLYWYFNNFFYIYILDLNIKMKEYIFNNI